MTPTNPDAAPAATRSNEALFRRQVDAWSRTDLDALLACYDDDMVYVDMPFFDAPVEGKDVFREHMTAYNSMFQGGIIGVEVVSLIASPTHVAGELLSTATYIGPGAPEGGVAVTWHATLVDEVRDGLVISEHAYFDPTAFERAVRDAAH